MKLPWHHNIELSFLSLSQMSIVHSFERYDDGEGNDNDEEESHVGPLSNP